MDKVPIFLCCWHVVKAWCLHGTKKIKDVDMWGAILQDFHDVMYMSIMEKQLMISKSMGGLL
jgi:hypothetical protein